MAVNYTLECSIDSVESALNAEKGGATRLELCSGLIIGGITPDICLFRQIRKLTGLPVYVLLRPRFGDFLYTDYEVAVLKENIRLFRQEGADGVVIGALTAKGDLDCRQLAELIRLSGHMSVTLHRAFDVCRDPLKALKEAKELGIHTILTSGQADNCYDGRQLLALLVEEAGNDIEILVGAGVDAEVIERLIPETGARHFHMSGKEMVESDMAYRRENVHMGLPIASEYALWRTDKENIAAARKVLEKMLR